MASATGATPAMTVSGAAAEMTVAVTPTAPIESARRVLEPDMDEDESEEVWLADDVDMATSRSINE